MPKAKKPSVSTNVSGMRIEEMSVDLLVPDPDNARKTLKPGDPGYEALVASLERFGLTQPFVWNQTTGLLVSGHQRLEIMKAKGVKTVPTVIVTMPPKEATALGLALNKIEGEFDPYKLVDALSGFDDPALLEATGFTVVDIAQLNADLAHTAGPVDDPDTPFEPSLEPSVKRKTVTKQQVEAAEQAQDERFVQGREPKDVTCPGCGMVFGVGGWLRDYIEKTEQLQQNHKLNMEEREDKIVREEMATKNE